MRKHLTTISDRASFVFWKKIPFSWYLLLFLVAVGIVFTQLKPQSADAGSSVVYLYHFAKRFVWVTAATVLGFSFVSAFFPWLLFKKKKTSGDIVVQLDRRDNNYIKLYLQSSMKPIGGFLKLRLAFANQYMSNTFLLEPIMDAKAPKGFTVYQLKTDLPNIAEYELEKLVFYFSDFLQFFRFPLSLDKKYLIVQTPEKLDRQNPRIRPQKTQSETEKVYSNRKSAGDLLHFKQYESNDDIRRIVWPLYAKTGELVVRHPEIHSQYASDALIYASFYSQQPMETTTHLHLKMLDFYKNIVYTSFQKLKEEDTFSVYLTTDQNSKAPLTSEKEVQEHIANCAWQHTQSLRTIAKKDNISLLIVSSLDNAEEVAEWAQDESSGMEILFVPLSEAFTRPSTKAWIKWVFTHQKDNQYVWDLLRWRLSPVRQRILENEKHLQHILSLRKSSLLAS
ncbi:MULTISPECIES: DUF58 domain-containing protein [Chitinophagaceae]